MNLFVNFAKFFLNNAATLRKCLVAILVVRAFYSIFHCFSFLLMKYVLSHYLLSSEVLRVD